MSDFYCSNIIYFVLYPFVFNRYKLRQNAFVFGKLPGISMIQVFVGVAAVTYCFLC